jgi:hypothetical protein
MRAIKLSVAAQSGIILSAVTLSAATPGVASLNIVAPTVTAPFVFQIISLNQPDGLGLGDSNCTCYLQILTISKVASLI